MRVVPGVIAVIVVGVLGVLAWRTFVPAPMAFAGGSTVALADYKGADPTGAPADLAKADAVKRGEYLARAADCLVCHTAPGGRSYAGGLAFPLPFGVLYSTNITADKETGIGSYSDQEFLDAVRRGVRKDGARLYPAMPFTSYTYLTDADALAIKAYLFSLPGVREANRTNTLAFPFNQRWSMTFWSLAFNPDTRFAPNSAKSPEWNRGAYIAEALAHCGECHTPRNLGLALDNRKKFAGALTRRLARFQRHRRQRRRYRRLERRRAVCLFVEWSRQGARHSIGADGGGGRPQLQPDGAGGYSRAGRVCAQRPRGCLGRAGNDRAAGTVLAEGRRSRVGCPRQKGVRAGLRELPRLERDERDFGLRHHFRHARRERSVRHECCADRHLRLAAAHAARSSFHACFRQYLFRHGNRRRRQLRHRPLRQRAVKGDGERGCCITRADGSVVDA